MEFETEVMMIPQFDPEHPQMISQGPSVCVFNKEDPQEVLASWLFTQYLLTNEVQIAYCRDRGLCARHLESTGFRGVSGLPFQGGRGQQHLSTM